MAERGDNDRARPTDPSFGDALRERSRERVDQEVVERFEAGRILYVREAMVAAEAELTILRTERDRLAEEGITEGPRIERLDCLISAAQADVAEGRRVLVEIDRVADAPRGGWSVIGSVLERGGAPPEDAEVVFVTKDDAPVAPLGTIPIEEDGTVARTYPAETVKEVAEIGPVRAAVRKGRRLVARDDTPAVVRPDGVHQFEIRISGTGPDDRFRRG